MHRSFIVVFFCLSFFLSSFSQKKDVTEYIRKAEEDIIVFSGRSTHQLKLPFKDIIVFDFRYDSSKIGYRKTGSAGLAFSKVKPTRNWTDIFNNYFAANLDASSNQSMVLTIRSFWIQEGILDEILQKAIIKKDPFRNYDKGGVCYAAIDVFVKTDSLVPLFKMEAPFFEIKKYKAKNLEDWFFLPFDSLMIKLSSYDVVGAKAKKKKISLNEMTGYYTSRLNLPVLQNTSFSKKGIFLTFEDFKNNKMLETDLRLSTGTLTDELYTRNGTQETIITDFWGFSDGKDLFIKVGYNIYKAVKQQNSFEVYGAKSISHYHSNPAPGDLLRINSLDLDNKILHLNMEKGKMY